MNDVAKLDSASKIPISEMPSGVRFDNLRNMEQVFWECKDTTYTVRMTSTLTKLSLYTDSEEFESVMQDRFWRSIWAKDGS